MHRSLSHSPFMATFFSSFHILDVFVWLQCLNKNITWTSQIFSNGCATNICTFQKRFVENLHCRLIWNTMSNLFKSVNYKNHIQSHIFNSNLGQTDAYDFSFEIYNIFHHLLLACIKYFIYLKLISLNEFQVQNAIICKTCICMYIGHDKDLIV